MNSTNKQELNRAVAALHSLLSQVSAIRLKEMNSGTACCGEIDILAQVEILGRDHTIACQISSGSDTVDVLTILQELRGSVAQWPGEITPVLIVPALSNELQSLCARNQAGCLDLRGNGRLSIGEVFVSMRSLPRRAFHRPASQNRTAALEGPVAPPATRAFPPLSAGLSRRSAQAAGRAHPA